MHRKFMSTTSTRNRAQRQSRLTHYIAYVQSMRHRQLMPLCLLLEASYSCGVCSSSASFSRPSSCPAPLMLLLSLLGVHSLSWALMSAWCHSSSHQYLRGAMLYTLCGVHSNSVSERISTVRTRANPPLDSSDALAP